MTSFLKNLLIWLCWVLVGARAHLNDLIFKKFINLAALCLSWGFFGGSDGEESACSVGDLGSIPGLGRSPGEGHGYPLQYSCLENSMDRGAWRATVHCVLKSLTWLGLCCGKEVFDLSCGAWDLVPWPVIELRPPALGVRSLSHWTTREVPSDLIFYWVTPLKSLSPNRVTSWGTAGEGGDREGIASLTQWTWVWANSSRWWRTAVPPGRKPGVLQSMGSQSRTWLSDWTTAGVVTAPCEFWRDTIQPIIM